MAHLSGKVTYERLLPSDTSLVVEDNVITPSDGTRFDVRKSLFQLEERLLQQGIREGSEEDRDYQSCNWPQRQLEETVMDGDDVIGKNISERVVDVEAV